jgi:hypothetical protein
MTRAEVAALVDRIWATWSIDQSMNARKAAYEAWFALLEDLDGAVCNRVLDELAIEDKPWAPRPGTLRKKVIDRTDPAGAAPSPTEAWTQFRSNAVAAANGGEVRPLHPLVRSTIDKLGASSEHALYTNGDREMFVRAYEAQMNLAEAERYRIR